MTYIAEDPKLNRRWLDELESAVREAAEPWEDNQNDLSWKSATSLLDVFPEPEELLELVEFARRSL